MRTILGVLLMAILVPTLALAQPPTAFIERSKVIATGEEIHLYGLPTLDSTGRTRYYDVTVTIDVRNSGRPATTATVSSVASPRVRTNEFVPGEYTGLTNGAGATCTLASSPFAGRTEATLHCVLNSNPGHTIDIQWYTGPIAGHPLEPQLTDAGLDALPGNAEYAWGRVGFSSTHLWFGCFNAPELVAARQVDDTVTVTNYGNDTTFDCQTNVFKLEP
jgi:hypothetical protein